MSGMKRRANNTTIIHILPHVVDGLLVRGGAADLAADGRPAARQNRPLPLLVAS